MLEVSGQDGGSGKSYACLLSRPQQNYTQICKKLKDDIKKTLMKNKAIDKS